MNAKKPASGTPWIDPDDAPALTQAFFEEADEFVGDRLIRRGRLPQAPAAQPVAVPCDPDVIEAFRATGQGWERRLNDVLKDWLKTHAPD